MNTESLFLHLSRLEDDSASFYDRLSRLTITMPKVKTLFSRLCLEEKAHSNLINLARSYQAQATEQFVVHSTYTGEIQKAIATLRALNEKIDQFPPMPPFLPLLEDVLGFEQEMESRHYSTYMDISDDRLRELLLQLTKFDRQHVTMIAGLIDEIKLAMQEGPE